MPAKYDKDHNANPGFKADKAKVEALHKNVAEIHRGKGRKWTAPTAKKTEEK